MPPLAVAGAVTAGVTLAALPVTVTAIPVAVAALPVTAGPLAVTAARPAAEVLADRFPLHDLDGDQRQLAAVVDLPDLDLDLVADLDHVVDVVDPGAAVQLADLRDVQQPVLAGQQRDR